MSTYKPGTVAVATVLGVEGIHVTRSSDLPSPAKWISATSVGGNGHFHRDIHVTDVRPLVVLDPLPLYEEGDTGTPARFANTLRILARADGGTYRARIIDRAADQIEAQTKPPRIPEPGLWAVVEGREGNRWVREQVSNGGLDWRHLGNVERHTTWVGICEPYGPITVLSEGVTA